MEFTGEKYRISVLTDRMIRLEYSEEGVFEDRPSFAVVNRNLEDNFEMYAKDQADVLRIETKYLILNYDKKEFSSQGLTIYLKENDVTWNFGEAYDDWSNLGGTARTLDDADGRVRLEKGLFGKKGYSVIDDSKSPVFDGNEYVKRTGSCVDVYFFGYGKDYYKGLSDFCRLSGQMPMIPRYALGNWWSRFYRYTEDSYMEVVENFAKEEIPISVAVIDMDWHITEVDPKYGSGWTGYSWNKDLFPDYKRFLKKLHDHKLAVTLNLHPADGIRAFEDMYEDFGRAYGELSGAKTKGKESAISDSNENRPYEFDFGDKKFRDAYFETVMHPYEDNGVDFWWIDWQQGTGKTPKDVDPLILLNHYHYEDQKKRNLRPMIFSRYAGVGSHRYPVGFSGDSHATWKSLDFQPYFTSNASNIGYGMWSHDIGGHMLGDKNLERLVRWIEYGVFSPIMRIHSSSSPFFNKEPWTLEEPYRGIVKKFMRLRHELIPYLYSENHRSFAESKPLVRPMYYDYGADNEESYEVPNQYRFGENLLVSPVTRPEDQELRLGCSLGYIPEGRWYDIFNGRIYEESGILKMYRDLSEMPVLIPAGGIVPLAKLEGELNDTGNPATLRILIGGGADGDYTLYEDDGSSMNYEGGAFVTTSFSTSFDAAKKSATFTIEPAQGDLSLIPKKRSYELEFLGIKGDSTKIMIPETSVKEKIVISLENVELLTNDYKKQVFEILDRAWIRSTDKDMVYGKLQNLDRASFSKWLRSADISENLKSAISEVTG
ncbi:MAG: glycoside hydrolase family 31 protein [Butyrivibrio sp.]|nr:glycoside hydrolase family 31 protein [Butyrivibrio sp.]